MSFTYTLKNHPTDNSLKYVCSEIEENYYVEIPFANHGDEDAVQTLLSAELKNKQDVEKKTSPKLNQYDEVYSSRANGLLRKDFSTWIESSINDITPGETDFGLDVVGTWTDDFLTAYPDLTSIMDEPDYILSKYDSKYHVVWPNPFMPAVRSDYNLSVPVGNIPEEAYGNWYEVIYNPTNGTKLLWLNFIEDSLNEILSNTPDIGFDKIWYSAREFNNGVATGEAKIGVEGTETAFMKSFCSDNSITYPVPSDHESQVWKYVIHFDESDGSVLDVRGFCSHLIWE